MADSINSGSQLIDVRDVIARVEELREERQNLADNAADAGQERADAEAEGAEAGFATADVAVTDAEDALAGWDNSEEATELKLLESLLDDLKGYGGDEQWEGDWYPVTLIHEDFFTEAMKDLCEDIGDLPKGFPDYMVIDWDATAENLRVDYASVELDGETFWYR